MAKANAQAGRLAPEKGGERLPMRRVNPRIIGGPKHGGGGLVNPLVL